MNIQHYGSTDLTLLTAHFGISLLHNCTKIQYLLYSNCSKCPPPVWKLVTRVSCGFSWDHVSTFHELFMPSRVKDTSSVNKMMLNSLYVLLSNGTNPYVEHGHLVPDVVPFDHGKDINLLHVKFATPAYMIRRCERPFYEWTDVDFSEPSQECSLMC